MQTAIEISKTLDRHRESVSPGRPASLTGANTPGDQAWQGDLGLEVSELIPAGFVKVEKPTDADRQLVPEAGAGSHHRLRSLEGVTLYRPKDYGPEMAGLLGPCVVFESPNAIVHEPGTETPHGTVNIEAPMIVQCVYQRNLDAETKRERRAID